MESLPQTGVRLGQQPGGGSWNSVQPRRRKQCGQGDGDLVAPTAVGFFSELS